MEKPKCSEELLQRLAKARAVAAERRAEKKAENEKHAKIIEEHKSSMKKPAEETSKESTEQRVPVVEVPVVEQIVELPKPVHTKSKHKKHVDSDSSSSDSENEKERIKAKYRAKYEAKYQLRQKSPGKNHVVSLAAHHLRSKVSDEVYKAAYRAVFGESVKI